LPKTISYICISAKYRPSVSVVGYLYDFYWYLGYKFFEGRKRGIYGVCKTVDISLHLSFTSTAEIQKYAKLQRLGKPSRNATCRGYYTLSW
jgi:hypothetical protein